MSTISYTGRLVVVSCWCGIQYAIPEQLEQHKQRGNSIHCPLGHQTQYVRSMADELAEAKRRAQATRDLLDQEQRSHAATRGHLTRQKKRVAAGVCPCCTRNFQNLARHMANKHPEFGSGA
jgi:hypothetical protein